MATINTKLYEKIFEDFVMRCPWWGDKVVSYSPRGAQSIKVNIDDGTIVEYQYATGTFRIIDDDSSVELTEDMSKKEFAMRLYNLMKERGHNTYTLSQSTGISRVMIGKYLNGQSEPGLTNIRRLASALRCTTADLVEF